MMGYVFLDAYYFNRTICAFQSMLPGNRHAWMNNL